MTNRTSGLRFVLFTSSQHLGTKLEHDIKQSSIASSITRVDTFSSLQKVLGKHGFHVVVFETKPGDSRKLSQIQQYVDPSQAFLLAGTGGALRRFSGLMQTLSPTTATPQLTHSSLETYLDSKLGDFVKGMKNGSARNLHPMLIKAVERPLICHALRETNGNQVKTANLLGMNRNTLRKKITELRIPINRVKPSKQT